MESGINDALFVTLPADLTYVSGIEPFLKILAPKDTPIFLDGNAITVSSEPLAVTQGEYTVRFVLGDYEVAKTVNAQNGRTYAVNLNVDATISEED